MDDAALEGGDGRALMDTTSDVPSIAAMRQQVVNMIETVKTHRPMHLPVHHHDLVCRMALTLSEALLAALVCF